MKAIQDLWILNESGIVIFHRLFNQSISPQAFGAMMSALNNFAEELTEGGLSNFELNNKRFTLLKRHKLIFIGNSSKLIKQKKINRELGKVSKKFLKLYSKDIDDYKGQIGAFTQFEEIIKDSLVESSNSD